MDDIAYGYLMERPVNYFYGVWDSDCSKFSTVEDILIGIRDGEWKDEIEIYRNEEDPETKNEFKKQLMAVTFSGTFTDKRHDSNLDLYNNILVIDIDLKDNKGSAATLRAKLSACPFIFAVFQSPSGGFKALAYSRIMPDSHDIFFRGVQEYLKHTGVYIDSSGSNLARLCFISYDPDLVIMQEDKRPFLLEQDAPRLYNKLQAEKFEGKREIDYSKYEESRDLNHIMKVAKNWCNKSGAYHKGNRNNYIFRLSCILNRAGVDKEVALFLIKDTYQSLQEKEVEATVKSAYSHNSFEFGSRPIWSKKTGQSNLF